MEAAKFDPTFICSSIKKSRFYMFSRRMPVDSGSKELGRDMFNENIKGSSNQQAANQSPEGDLPTNAILYTSMGEILV